MKKKAIIVDLDGTLSNSEHRQHYMQQKKKDWDSFYEGMSEDEPNGWCEVIVDLFVDSNGETLSQENKVAIIFVTGRPNKYESITVEWLSIKCDYYRNEYELFMRDDGDFRPDYVIKQEIYDNYIKDHFEVLFCIDDRQQVVDMWRRNGLVCLQCAKGDF